MNRWKFRQVLECASLLALWLWRRANRKRQRDWRSPRRYRAIPRFMVPKHFKKKWGLSMKSRRVLIALVGLCIGVAAIQVTLHAADTVATVRRAAGQWRREHLVID